MGARPAAGLRACRLHCFQVADSWASLRLRSLLPTSYCSLLIMANAAAKKAAAGKFGLKGSDHCFHSCDLMMFLT